MCGNILVELQDSVAVYIYCILYLQVYKKLQEQPYHIRLCGVSVHFAYAAVLLCMHCSTIPAASFCRPLYQYTCLFLGYILHQKVEMDRIQT